MTNLRILQGLKADLPSSATVGSLLFTTDTGEIFKGNGEGQPLTAYTDVLYGYADLADLQSKNPNIQGKLYLTNDDKLYTLSNGEYKALSDAMDIDSGQIDFDNTDTGLTAETVEDAIKELKEKVDENEGKIKITETDTNGFLGDKLHATLAFEDGVLKVKNIDGLTIGVSDINTFLTGTTGNIQGQINTLVEELEVVTKGLDYLGMFDTLSELQALTDKTNGNLAVVTNVDGDGGSELYIYSETSTQWQKIGKFEFSETFIGLKDTPSAYQNGKYLKSTATGIEFADITYAEIQGTPDVSVEDVEDAVEKAHEHTNKAVLDKLSENVDGEVEYNGSPLSVKWESFQI